MTFIGELKDNQNMWFVKHAYKVNTFVSAILTPYLSMIESVSIYKKHHLILTLIY